MQVFTYVIHNGGDGGGVDRPLCLKSLDVIQRSGVKQLRGNKGHQTISTKYIKNS